MITVLIADDHPLIREGITQVLQLECSDIKVVAQASNGAEAIRLANEIKPDVILMDINMPDTNGIQAISKIKQMNLPSKIIVLTIHDDREYLVKTIQLGADGYILKDTDVKVLVEAIRSVCEGQSFIQPSMTKQLVNEFNKVTLKKHQHIEKDENKLTDREIEVLQLLAEGMLNKEIAKELFISEKTVKNHVSSIFGKIGVSDRTQAAIYALKHNIKK